MIDMTKYTLASEATDPQSLPSLGSPEIMALAKEIGVQEAYQYTRERYESIQRMNARRKEKEDAERAERAAMEEAAKALLLQIRHLMFVPTPPVRMTRTATDLIDNTPQALVDLFVMAYRCGYNIVLKPITEERKIPEYYASKEDTL